jgi:muconolactone delta-isomerase
MQFAVIVHSVDQANVPPQVAIGLVKQTFQMLNSNKESRIKAAYPFAGERAGIFIVDVTSGDELQEVISNLPFSGIVKTEIHAIGSVQSALKSVEEAERRILAMAPAGAAR